MPTNSTVLRSLALTLTVPAALAGCAMAQDVPPPGPRDSGTDARADVVTPADVRSAPDTAPSPDVAPPRDSATGARDGGLVALGASYVNTRQCGSCHQSSNAADGILSGGDTPVAGTAIYGPNITPDNAMGIGGWTDAQIIGAMRTGLDDQGATLCWVMPRFANMSDAEAAAIVAYLRSLTAVARTAPDGVCPPDPDAGTAMDAAADARADVSRADAASDVPVAGDGGCAPTLRINEVQTAGAGGAADEFVEIYNASTCAASLTNWELRYASATGTPARRWLGAATDAIAAHGYVVLAGTGFTGTSIGALGGTTGALSGTAGGLGLYDPGGTLVDGVGYGATATNVLVETAPAPAPASGQSIIRSPDGHDTNDNSADFAASTTPTPNAANR
jgi:hypothetical protein